MLLSVVFSSVFFFCFFFIFNISSTNEKTNQADKCCKNRCTTLQESNYFCTPVKRTAWKKMMLVNIAKAGFFSSDRTILEYERDIWKLRDAA